jgi:hypothetical protein
MLAQVFNPTEIRKNGAARKSVSTLHSAVSHPSQQRPCCLPRAKRYGDA